MQKGSRVGAGLLPLAALLLTANSSAFQSSRLSYTRESGAEHCPDEAALRASVASRLGYEPFDEVAARTIVARIVRKADRLEAHVELVDDGGARYGRRELSSTTDDCDELVSSMALSVSLAIDPERVQLNVPVVELPSAEPNGDESPPDRPPEPSRDAGVQAPSLHADRRLGEPISLVPYSGAAGHVTVGSAPGATFGVTMFGGLEWPGLALEMEARIDAPGSAELESGGEISASLFAASLLPCLRTAELFVCASATAGVIRATSRDVSDPKDDEGFFGALGGRVRLELPLGSELSFFVHADLWATLTRAEIELDGRTVWRAPPVSAASGAGLLARFP